VDKLDRSMPPSSDPVLVVLKSQLVSALNPHSKILVGNGSQDSRFGMRLG
jgi:hypothetical protein